MSEEDLKKEVENLKKKLEESEKLKEEYLAGWQRARADLINYKREEMERIGSLLTVASENLFLDFLPILDNLETAEKAIPDNLREDQTIKGFLQVKKQILDFFRKRGIEEIRAVGEKFDPNFHEVVEEVETDEFETGTVIEEIQKGYKINGRLLRAAKVKVAK